MPAEIDYNFDTFYRFIRVKYHMAKEKITASVVEWNVFRIMAFAITEWNIFSIIGGVILIFNVHNQCILATVIAPYSIGGAFSTQEYWCSGGLIQNYRVLGVDC